MDGFLGFNDKGQILAVHNKRGWDIPGGHVETGETAEQALHREVLEEACAIIEDLILFMSATAQKTMLFYAARVKELLSFKAENETDERKFMRPEELLTVYGGGEPELASHVITAGLNIYNNGILYTENNEKR